MNKLYSKLLSVFLICTLLMSATAFAGGLPSYNIGDVDNNGSVEPADARLTLRAAVNLENYAKNTQKFLSADADSDGQITASDARLILRVSLQLDKFCKAENVAGYPKMDGDKRLLALFVNGKRMSSDAYTYGDSTDIYVEPCRVCWDGLGIDATSTSRSLQGVIVGGAFAARINGKVVVNQTGSSTTKVGNDSYPDIMPEYYNEDFYCSLLMFKKVLNAEVEFSPDFSAAYVSTDKAYAEGSKCDDFDLDYDGTLKYEGPADNGFTPSQGGDTPQPLEEPTKPSEEPTKPSDKPTTIVCPNCSGTGRRACSACGGSGKTWGTRTEYRYMPGPTPGSSIMMPTQVPCQVTCMSCGGAAFRICASCGGSGRLTVN